MSAGLGSGPRRRRRGAVRGLPALPVSGQLAKNQSRWQFGVLGPQGAADAGIGEDDSLSAQIPVQPHGDPSVSVVVRFLQLQRRGVERDLGGGRFEPVAELDTGTQSWLSWDEAVERELAFGPFDMAKLAAPQTLPIAVAGGTDIEAVDGGRLVRTRNELNGELTLGAEPDDGLLRLSLDCAQHRRARRRQGRRDRRVIDRHAPHRRSHRWRVRLAARTARVGRRRGGRAAGSIAAFRCWPAGPASATWCWSRRSSSTTTRRSPNRARVRCTTPRRSTRSSPCG